MSFACQRDSYQRELDSKVIKCQPSKLNGNNCYEVVCEDTILFPEGGGQPDDRGKINNIEVLRVMRDGAVAVHFTAAPVAKGEDVHMAVDWGRRFDHMQQHSGQHLITAVADKMFDYKTTSWNLAIGEDNKCFIELNTKQVTDEQIQAIEQACNDYIRSCIPVEPRWLQSDDPELDQVRSRGLPDDHVGLVRVVEMKGIDSNMCCGTHVKNLSDIQVIKLLHCESKRGSTLLFYVAGNRVTRSMQKLYTKERALTKILSAGADDHIECVEKLHKVSRNAAKVSRNHLREIAELTVSLHLNSLPVSKICCIHREDGDNEFMNIVANKLTEKGILVFASVGGDKGAGQFLLAGDEAQVSALGPR